MAMVPSHGAREVAKDEETGEPIIAPFILWEPQYVDVTAVEAMQAASETKSPAARDEAVKFLKGDTRQRTCPEDRDRRSRRG
jgi:hypothetical protein